MDKPLIELKNIKHAEFASEETHCFSATVYVDGKRFAEVSNDGHGGCDSQTPVDPFTWDDLKKLEERIQSSHEWSLYNHETGKFEKLTPEQGKKNNKALKPSLEGVCCDLVNEHFVIKDLKKALRKITFLESPDSKDLFQIGTIKTTKTHGAEFKAHVMKKYPNAVILNDLDFNKALDIYKKVA